MFPFKSGLRAGAAVALMLLAGAATALPEDRQQPIRITANSMVQEATTVTYTDNVVIVQGTLRIEAAKVVVHYVENRLQRVVATGAPVRFQQQPEPNSGLIHGTARSLVYYHGEQRVELIQDALVDRDQSTVKGSRIEYFITSRTVRAEGAGTSSTGQVEMVLQPDEGPPGSRPPPAEAP